MKRLLPYAGPFIDHDPAWNLPLKQLPNLMAWFPQLRLKAQQSVARDSLNPSQDYAYQYLQNQGQIPGELLDGTLPCLAAEAAQNQLLYAGTPHFTSPLQNAACLTPVHAMVATDSITLMDPCEVPLSVEDSETLFQAVAPIFESEGVSIKWVSAMNWQVSHPSLAGLALPSIERVLAQSVQYWQTLTPVQPVRLLRRLQSEAQMVLYAHPLNQAREARGLPSINSLWLGPVKAECSHTAQPTNSAQWLVDWRLRSPYLHGDAKAWCAAWQAFDKTLEPLSDTFELALAHSTGYVVWATHDAGDHTWLESLKYRLKNLTHPQPSLQSLLNPKK